MCKLEEDEYILNINQKMKLILPRIQKNSRYHLSQGQAVIGLIIAIAVFAILMSSLFTLVSSSYNLVSYNRSRIAARQLAQEKIELIRNLKYDDVGVVGGIPPGIIEPEENIKRNDLSYLIKTTIIYIDDSFDEIAPSDTFPTDYKRARIEVSWQGVARSGNNPLVLYTDVAPTNLTTSFTGTLEIEVTNANGQPVPQAQVSIIATGLTPPVNTTQLTNSDGKVTLPGAQVCNSCYQITVTKSGYSTDRTYSTSEIANPIKEHTSILQGQVTQVFFAIDLTGTITINSVNTRENNFATLGNVEFRLHGNKIIGIDAYNQSVYKYDENLTTDTSGTTVITDLEWDAYNVSMPTATSWDISGTNPLIPLNLVPQGNISFIFSASSHSDNSLFTMVKNTAQELIEGATVRLYDASSYDVATISGILGTPDYGQVFFPSLNQATYHIEATASGYLNLTKDVDVSGSSQEVIIMNP